MRCILLFIFSFISVASTTPSLSENDLIKPLIKRGISNSQIQQKKESDNLQQAGNEKLKKTKHKKKNHDNDRSVNRRAVWGFIFGLASVVIFPLLAIPGLILSNDALREERMHPRILTKTNKTLAYLGKIFSYIGIAIMIVAILYLAFIVAFLSALG
jgi:hypothetical protein